MHLCPDMVPDTEEKNMFTGNTWLYFGLDKVGHVTQIWHVKIVSFIFCSIIFS